MPWDNSSKKTEEPTPAASLQQPDSKDVAIVTPGESKIDGKAKTTPEITPKKDEPALPANPAPAQADVTPPAPPAVSLPDPKKEVVQEPPKTNNVEAPKPAPTAVVKNDEPQQSDVEKARSLWNKAIDSEINRDFVEAVRCYNEIKKLDKSAWPKTLDMRLDAARQQLPQG
jgi:hypothetical protein